MDTSPDKSGARQFSLRKLMLWMVLCPVYLGIVRLAGISGIYSVFVMAFFAVILIVHVWRGAIGAFIAIVGLTFVVVAIRLLFTPEVPWYVSKSQLFVFSWGVFTVYGVLGYMPGWLLLSLIDWLDTLGRKTSPPDS